MQTIKFDDARRYYGIFKDDLLLFYIVLLIQKGFLTTIERSTPIPSKLLEICHATPDVDLTSGSLVFGCFKSAIIFMAKGFPRILVFNNIYDVINWCFSFLEVYVVEIIVMLRSHL